MKKLKLNKNELIESYVDNNYISKELELIGSNLNAYYIGNKRVLKNYNTIIAVIDTTINDALFLNINKYSQTTSTNQNKLKALANAENIKIMELTEKQINELVRM